MDSATVLAIDLQNGLFARPDSLVRDAAGVVERTNTVITAAAEADIPIVVIQDDAGPLAHSTLSGIDAPAEDHIDALNREVSTGHRRAMPVDGATAAEVARRLRGET